MPIKPKFFSGWIIGLIMGVTIFMIMSLFYGSGEVKQCPTTEITPQITQPRNDFEASEQECLCEPIYITQCDRAEVESCYIDLDQQTDLYHNCKLDLTGCRNEVKNLTDFINASK